MEAYTFIMSLSDSDKDYCESLDRDKLKKECELGYFSVDELFTKEQIIESSVAKGMLYSIDPVKKEAPAAFPIIHDAEAYAVFGNTEYSVKVDTHLVQVVYDAGGDLESYYNLAKLIKRREPIKLRVNPKQARVVQEICFSLGVNWPSTIKEFEYIAEPFLFIWVNPIIQKYSLSYDDSIKNFNKCTFKEYLI